MSLLLPSFNTNRSFPENFANGELDFCVDEFSYATFDVRKLSLNNHYVTYQGIVYNSSYRLVTECLINPAQYTPPTFFKLLKKVVLRRKRKVSSSQKFLYCYDEWTNNHYHWLCDFMPRLELVREELPNYTLLLPETDYIKNTGVELLSYFDLRPGKIEFIKPGEVIKIPQLDMVTHAALPGRTNDTLIQRLKSNLLANEAFSEAEGMRRIYLRRKNALSRKVLNEDEVIRTLRQYDFEVIEFDEISIADQINICKETGILVSIHGAGLTNSFFLPPEASVLEFRRNEIYHNQCYWHLADALGLKYYYLFGTPDAADQVIEGPNGCNLTIPIPLLKDTIEKMITDSKVSKAIRMAI